MQPQRNDTYRLICLALPFCIGLLLSGCQRTPTVLKIGLIAPFEGETREIGYDAIYAARLGVREFNERHPLRDRYRLALVALDDSGDAGISQDATLSLIADPAIVAVLGYQPDGAFGSLFQTQELLYIGLGESPFLPVDPSTLDPDYVARYEAVTPFEETTGPFAGPTSSGLSVVIQAIEGTVSQGLDPTRASIYQESDLSLTQ